VLADKEPEVMAEVGAAAGNAVDAQVDAATGAAADGEVQTPSVDFEPRIVAFCCYYCAYSAADLAGSMRLQYPTNIRIIEVPCSGKVDPVILLKAFEEGADGVYVAGCMEGDCHFLKGNFRAKKRVHAVKKILDQIGLGGERLEMFNLSASMGTRFVEIAEEMTERIKRLGPSPIRPEAVAARKAAAAAGGGGAGAAGAGTGGGPDGPDGQTAAGATAGRSAEETVSAGEGAREQGEVKPE